VDRLASRMSSNAGSRLLLVSAMTGFSASTTSLAASGSVDSSRLQNDKKNNNDNDNNDQNNDAFQLMMS